MSNELRDALGMRDNRPNFGPEPYGEPYWARGLDSAYLKPWHLELQKRARAFVEEHVDAHLDDWEGERRFPLELWRRAGEAGLLNYVACTVGRPWPFAFRDELHVPLPTAERGPEASDHFGLAVVVREICRPGSGALTYALIVALHMGLMPVYTFGSEELKRRIVGPVLRGEKIICLGTAEAEAGIDVARIRTTAVRRGDVYVVNGSKMWTTASLYADYIVTMVRTRDDLPYDQMQRGLSMLVIDASAEGVRREPLSLIGCHPAGQCRVIFEDVQVPVTNLVGAEGNAFRFINYNSDHAAYLWLMANVATGLARTCLRDVFMYATQRSVFGTVLVQRDAIREKLATMMMEVESAEAMAEVLTYNMGRFDWGSRSSKRLLGRCALAKTKSTRTLETVVSLGMKILGGKGLTMRSRGTIVERLYRDAPCYSVPGGTQEVLSGLAVRQAVLYERPQRLKAKL